MATKLPKVPKTVPKTGVAAGDAVAAPVKPPILDVPADPVAAPPVGAVPTVKPVVEAVKPPATPSQRAAKIAKVKAIPVRPAAVAPVRPVAAPKPIIKKAAKAVVTAARTVATPASKEPTIMATLYETPKLFTDMTDRTKGAVEKSQKLASEMTEFSKGNVEAIVEATRIAAKGAEDILKYTTEYGRSTVEAANASAKRLASVKSPAEFFQLQGDVAKSVVDALVSESAKFTENYLKLMSEASQPLSNRFALAAEKIKSAA